MSTIERLEHWKSGHKSRSVEINCDNGYGASCWEVVLCWHGHGGNVKAVAYEAQFITGTPPSNVAVVDWSEHNDDWPGLGPTIEAALLKAAEMGAP